MTDLEPIGEREHLQHLQESSFGKSNLLVLLDQVDFTKYLNSTLGDLGGNGESLKEGCLLWTQTSVLRRDKHIYGCNGSSPGWSCYLTNRQYSQTCLSYGTVTAHLVCQNELSHISQFLRGEHKANVSLDAGQDFLKVWALVKMTTDSLPHGRVLAHDEHPMASQGGSDLLHLLGTNIVHIHHKEPWVFIKQGL